MDSSSEQPNAVERNGTKAVRLGSRLIQDRPRAQAAQTITGTLSRFSAVLKAHCFYLGPSLILCTHPDSNHVASQVQVSVLRELNAYL